MNNPLSQSFQQWILRFCVSASLVGWLGMPDLLGQSPESAAVITARRDPDFLIQGEYVGDGLGLQVIAVGEGEFELVVYAGGLPGAGWDRSEPQRADGDATAVAALIKNRQLKRIERTSPTLGALPPAGASLLFDGSEGSLANWQAGARMSEDHELMPAATTRQTFRDYVLHVEFQTPFQPKATGQGRGNSGIYHQGRYETQILDSFGLAGKNNEAGGIYEVRDPDLNMCLPPLSWQTYDVEFTAARFDDAGQKKADAVMTVRLNGVVVQRDVRVSKTTRAAPEREAGTPGPIHLQNHGNPVRFRNIWILPRDADQEALRPRVPGFERFFASTGDGANDQVVAKQLNNLGGRLLIAQLGCAACHATQDPALRPKAAPNLGAVAARVRLDHLVSYVGQPHQTKPGTTMPDVFHGLTGAERAQRAAELVSWLAQTGTLVDRPGDSAAQKRGEQAYHTLGCAVCHAPRRGQAVGESTSVPLGNLTAKYTLDSLTQLLLNPHAVRSSGMMPKLVSNPTEARDIACYLLGDAILSAGSQQFQVSVYHGAWDRLPDFSQLKAVKTGTTSGLDLSIAGRNDEFALSFEAFLPVQQAGEYTFYLGSDDGSRLLIDGEEVVKFDGVHPFQFRKNRKQLSVGVHALRVEYFENSGGEQLELEMEGPGLGRVPVALLAALTAESATIKPLIADKFQPAASLVNAGRQVFERSGCANCHKATSGDQATLTTIEAPPLDALKTNAGCLAEKVPAQAVDYALTRNQRQAIVAALGDLKRDLGAAELVHLRLAQFNCYACHSRGLEGGPEQQRDGLFVSKVPEMGNEGRLPPPLTGAGDKLRREVIERIVSEGAKQRPYMLTRMPAFGADAITDWVGPLISEDERAVEQAVASAKLPANPDTAEQRAALVAAGRKLVGSGGLACIKCHTFGGKATPGIQAIDMLTMPERLKEGWFHRYMLAPAQYRPGTRMPLSFPEGKSVVTDVLAGHADQQIQAMWLYLSQGSQAKAPAGLSGQTIALVPTERPIIYRNFLEGLGPRGIAVGYPQRVHLAWDAGTMSLAQLWKNDFIDAAKHWVGRGPGEQGPLGDLVIPLAPGVTVASLPDVATPWPAQTGRELGYHFSGYTLDASGQPIFHYRFDHVTVDDGFSARAEVAGGLSGFERQLTITTDAAGAGVVARLARGRIEAVSASEFKIDSSLNLRLQGAPAQIVSVGDKQELRVAIAPAGKTSLTMWLWW